MSLAPDVFGDRVIDGFVLEFPVPREEWLRFLEAAGYGRYELVEFKLPLGCGRCIEACPVLPAAIELLPCRALSRL